VTFKDELQDTTEKLRKQRDELSVKIHLASMEVRDEWEQVEEKWDEFTARSKQVYKEVEPSLGEIRAALSLLGSELEAGYEKIKSALKHSR
jgi:redox-regulated HSP33 family molecular chaperone